ncbi:MAG TPA: SH3 domain-containing protein [Kiritimatiellia bacterium]|nr:SH3 domain-containing protein [Kiritimatiellia bacterium]HOM58989.1 SH3 domain-containing protein [Kiritimatiellia bacterium]HOR96993.1 SH3 domain-containing protein [Kiritimatiellia bacterium]HPC49390.1 SH3 domain-containing protein [Kiritimatiellia bacterium]HPK37384.1 SH3 domain-containing protein [Kiritimatiellia bacterium]
MTAPCTGRRIRHMKTSLRTLAATVVLLFGTGLPLHAGELVSGRLYTVPETIYVNQAFEIYFELEVTFGSEVEDLRIRDFPNQPDLLTVGRLVSSSRNRTSRDGKTLDTLQYKATARCHKPFHQTFTPLVQCMLVERRNTGFFSHWQSFPKQMRLDPFTLAVRDLPDQGRPEAFSGAIGTFRLTGRLSQTEAHPGDIITLTLNLKGKGWLGEQTVMPAPAVGPMFKRYPVKELLREDAHLRTEQIFIPQTTNATEIAAVRFHYFNPATGQYEASVAGPFRLTLRDAPAEPVAQTIRMIDTVRPTTASEPPQTISIRQVNRSVRHALPLLIGGAGALAAFFIMFLLGAGRRRIAIPLALLALGVSLGAAYRIHIRADAATRNLTEQVDVRLAPARAAFQLFSLPAGTEVIPLETSASWVRIDADGRRGWIRAEALGDPTTVPKGAP